MKQILVRGVRYNVHRESPVPGRPGRYLLYCKRGFNGNRASRRTYVITAYENGMYSNPVSLRGFEVDKAVAAGEEKLVRNASTSAAQSWEETRDGIAPNDGESPAQ